MATGAHPPDETEPERWTASQQYADMWVDPDDDPRDTGVALTGERATILEYLRAYRLTMEMKCTGRDAEQLAMRSVPPSTMSLLGLPGRRGARRSGSRGIWCTCWRSTPGTAGTPTCCANGSTAASVSDAAVCATGTRRAPS